MNAVNSPPLDANQMARTAIVIVLTSATGSILWVGSDSNMWLIERWIKLLFSSKNPETCAACLLVCEDHLEDQQTRSIPCIRIVVF